MIQEALFDFGIEEFAVVLSLMKKMEEAKGLLINTFGNLSQEEEKGRLLAAYNSLFARSLITFDKNQVQLHPDIQNLVDIFFSSRKMLKIGKTAVSGENLLSFYFYENIWLEHSIVQGVAYHFAYPLDEQAIFQQIVKFLKPTATLSVSSKAISIPSEILNSPRGTLNNYDTVLAILSQGIPKASLEMQQFAEDMVNAKWRGSIVWLNHPAEDQILSRGDLWVQGQERLWVINSTTSGETNALLAICCSQTDFDLKIKDIISTKTTA